MAEENFRAWIKDIPDFEGEKGIEFLLEFGDRLTSIGRAVQIYKKAQAVACRHNGQLDRIERKTLDGEWETIP